MLTSHDRAFLPKPIMLAEKRVPPCVEILVLRESSAGMSIKHRCCKTSRHQLADAESQERTTWDPPSKLQEASLWPQVQQNLCGRPQCGPR